MTEHLEYDALDSLSSKRLQKNGNRHAVKRQRGPGAGVQHTGRYKSLGPQRAPVRELDSGAVQAAQLAATDFPVGTWSPSGLGNTPRERGGVAECGVIATPGVLPAAAHQRV